MSYNNDERVVELQFKNKQFEANVSQTLSTLDKLKEKLNFDEQAKSLNELEKASRNFQLEGIERSLDAIQNRFSVMGIAGMRVIENLVDSAMSAGERLVKSLSIDQVSSGWDKYAKKTAAVQTIMSATAKQFSDTKVQMAYVEEELSKLSWFTDETSYSFLDMVNNIGKFTSNNIELNKSVTAMQGISNWAAVSGANIQEAGRAMYNLSQAIAVGSVKLMDWKSIENANMATAEFKQTAIDTAVAVGTLKKTGDGLYKTLKGNAVSVSNFNQNLSDAWFTSEVLLSTLDKYGGFTDELYKVAEASDLTATQILSAVEEYKAGLLDVSKYAKDSTVSANDLNDMIVKLAGSEYDLGYSAFKAAQEAKTFQEAIDSVKDAVSSGWMETFEIIFGNYTEAKKLWTSLANTMYDVFAEGGNRRNALLRAWKELGGQEDLIQGFKNLGAAVESVITPIKEAYREIFPKTTAERLASITAGWRKLTEALTASTETAAGVRRIFTSIFAVVRGIITVTTTTAKVLVFVALALGQLVANGLSAIGVADKAVERGKVMAAIISGLTSVFKGLVSLALSAGSAIGAIINLLANTGVLEFVGRLLSGIGTIIGRVATIAGKFFVLIGSGRIEVLALAGAISALAIFVIRLLVGIRHIGKVLVGLGESVDQVYGYVKAMKQQMQLNNFQKIAISIALVAGSVALLSSIDTNRLWSAIGALTVLGGLVVGLGALTAVLSKLQKAGKKGLSAFGKIATSLLVLAVALRMLNGVKTDGLLTKSAIIVGMFAILAALGSLIKRLPTNASALTMLAASMLLLTTALSNVPDSAGKKALILIGMTGALAVVAGLLGRISPMLSSGSLGLVAMAASIRILVGALNKLSEIQVTARTIMQLIAVMAALAIVAAIAKRVRLTSGIGLLAAAVSILGVVAVLKKIETYNIDDLKNTALRLGVVFAALGGIALAMRLIPANAASRGIAILLMVGALAAVAKLISTIEDPNWSGVGLITAIGAIGIVLAKGASILKFSMADVVKLIAIVAMLGLLIKTVSAIGEFALPSESELIKIGATLVGLLGSMGVAVAIANKAGSVLKLIGLVSSMAIIMGALSVLPKVNLTSMIATFGGVVLLVGAMWAASQIAVKTNLVSIAAIALEIVVIAAALATLSTYDINGLVAGALALSLGLVGFAGAMKIASTLTLQVDWKSVVLMLVTLAGISASLYILANLPADNLLKAGLAIAGVAVAVAAAGKLATGAVAGLAALTGAMLSFSAAILSVSIAFVAFGVAGALLGVGIRQVTDGLISLGEAGPEVADNIRYAIEQICIAVGNGVVTILGSIAYGAGQIVPLIVQGVFNGVTAAISTMWTAGKNLIAALFGGVEEEAEIHSPSLKAAWEVLMVAMGFKKGADGAAGDVASSAGETLGKKATDALGSSDILNAAGAAGSNVGATFADRLKSSLSNSLGGFAETAGLSGVFDTWSSIFGDDRTRKIREINSRGKKRTEYERAKLPAEAAKSTNDYSNALTNLTSASGSAGKASSKLDKDLKSTEKEIDTLTQITDYAAETVNVFNNQLLESHKNLGNAKSYDVAKAKTEELALAIYKAKNPLDANIQALKDFHDATAEQLADMKQAWLDYYGAISEKFTSTYGGFSDVLSGKSDADKETFETALNTIQHNTVAAEGMYKAFETLQKKGLSDSLMQQLWEDNDLMRILGWAEFSEEQIAQLNKMNAEREKTITEAASFMTDILPKEAAKAGVEAMTALTDGMKSVDTSKAEGEIWTTMADAFMQMMSGEKPDYSKVSAYGLGEYMMEGLSKGITGFQDLAIYAIQRLGEAMVEQLRKEMEAGKKQMEFSFSSGGSVFSFGSDGAMHIQALADQTAKDAAMAELISSVASGAVEAGKTSAAVASSSQNAVNQGAGNENVTNNYNFVQNNTSPKALSANEIYRNSKNLLAAHKSATDAAVKAGAFNRA